MKSSERPATRRNLPQSAVSSNSRSTRSASTGSFQKAFAQTNFINAYQEIISRRILPDLQSVVPLTVITALPRMKEMAESKQDFPPEVQMTRRKLVGTRKLVRGVRYGRIYHHAARWPDDGLIEARIPLLVYISSGTADMRLGDYELRVPRGSYLLIPPNTPFADNSLPHLSDANREHGYCELFWMAPLSPSMAGAQIWLCSSRQDWHSTSSGEKPCFVLNHTLTTCFQTLVDEIAILQSINSQQLIIRGLLMTIFSIMVRELSSGRAKKVGQFETHECTPQQNDPIGQVCLYVREHLSKPLHIDEVAGRVYLSRTQFTQRFRREMNMSFIEYVNVERLKESRRLLRDSDWSIEAIAAVVGTTPIHLRELFRRELKVSPSEFRSKSRDN